MKSGILRKSFALGVVLFTGRMFSAPISPISINFEDQPAGPSLFVLAGPAQTLTYNFSGETAVVTGGVILTNETNQTTDNSNVYATISGDNLSSNIKIQFSVPVQNFQMDILNALAGSYTLSDNAGHFQNFQLATTGGSIATESFTTAGTVVTVSYNGPGVSDASFDYAIDNLVATPSACAAAVAGAVTLGMANNGATMTAAFTPNAGMSLAQAAAQCGVQSFNWQQTVTTDPYPPKAADGTQLSPPYLDPPVGGYLGGPADNAYPYYWNSNELAGGSCPLNGQSVAIQTSNTLTFCDTPAEPQLQNGQYLAFDTELLGIGPNQSSIPLFDFDWTSNFGGTVQGVSARGNPNAPDPNSGTGGVTLTAVNGVATPEPASVLLTMVSLSLVCISSRKLRRKGR